MAFETSEKLKLWTNMTTQTEQIQTNIRIPAAYCSRVLAVSAKPMIKGFEQIDRELGIAARIVASVVFVDVNGTCDSASAVVDTSHKLTVDLGGKPFLFAKEIQTTVEGITDQEILLSTKLEIFSEQYFPEEFSIQKPGNAEFFEQTKELVLHPAICFVNDKFSVSNEFEVDADKVLFSDAAVKFNKALSFEDSISVDGEIFANLLVEKQGKVQSISKNFPFSQEIAAVGAKQNLGLEIRLVVNSSTCILEDDEKSIANLSVNLGIFAIGYDTVTTNTVQDIFSDKVQVLVSTEGVTDKISQTSETEISRKILTFSSKDKSVNIGSIVGAADGNIESTEGNQFVVQCTVIYWHADTGELSSFVVSAKFEKETKEASFEDVVIKNVSRKKQNEVELEIELFQTKVIIEETYETFISKVEEGPVLEENNFAITVYSATKGQSLFEIAKEMGTSPEIIKTQNPLLENVLEEDKKIVLYRQSNAKF